MVWSFFIASIVLVVGTSFIPETCVSNDQIVASNENIEIVYQTLLEKLGEEKVKRDIDSLDNFKSDHSHSLPGKPDVVVFSETLEDVEFVVKTCDEHNTILTPVGSNTGLSGSTNPYEGGVMLSMKRMKNVVDFQPENQLVTVEPGIRVNELNEYLKPLGFMFPVLPGSSPSIGGGTSTRASGTMTIKYNTFKENVVRLQVVLPNGKTIWTRSQAIKSAAGYDLTPLFVGSEGTLGVITKVTLKIVPAPKFISGGLVKFKSIREAANAVIALKYAQINGLARLEIINVQGINAVNTFANTDFEAIPTLFMEFHGSSQAELEMYSSQAQQVSQSVGGHDFQCTLDEEKRKEMWYARNNAYHAIIKIGRETGKPNCKHFSTDVCVPLSSFADIVEETETDFEDNDIGCAIVGHAGDANFHTLSCIDFSDADEVERVDKIVDRLVKRALDVGGTSTGEHGIGVDKLKYMTWEFSEDALDVMRALKMAVDPKNLMNPGKVLPPPRDEI